MPGPTETTAEGAPQETPPTPADQAASIAAEAEFAARMAEAAAENAAQTAEEMRAQETAAATVQAAAQVAETAAAQVGQQIAHGVNEWQQTMESRMAELLTQNQALATANQEMREAISAIPALLSAQVQAAISAIAPATNAPPSGAETQPQAPADPAAEVPPPAPPKPAPEKPRRSWI